MDLKEDSIEAIFMENVNELLIEISNNNFSISLMEKIIEIELKSTFCICNEIFYKLFYFIIIRKKIF